MMLCRSQVRGDAEPGSDIDILVVRKGEVSPCEEIARSIADVWLHDNEVVCCI
jgi:predicted nucleotidyltransferase